jgi:glutamate-1-semialdehyde 2,1-aminomutase
VRCTSTGTAAALLARRLARHATGRRRFIMCEGGFHGTGPEFLDPGPDAIRVPYDDLAALQAALAAPGAAVFVEAFLGSGGVLPGRPECLRPAQAASPAAGALFVLDEVQALRNASRGMHAALGVRPDLRLLGTIIGGGLPAGARGGQADLLELTAASRAGALSHAGTLQRVAALAPLSV